MKEIVLIIPPANLGYGYINAFFWQKGALHIATYINRNTNGEYHVTIFDGNNRTMDECIKMLLDNIYYAVGVYCLDHTRDNGEKIIKTVINQGIPKLFLGGPGIINSRASYCKRISNKNNKTEILYSEGQGEKEILNFLVFNNRISIDSKNWDMNIYDENEKDLFFEAYEDDLRSYLINQKRNLNYPYPALTYSTLSHLGCSYRKNAGGCSFCGIPHNFYHVIRGDIFWNDFKNFCFFCNKKFGYSFSEIRSIKDWGDSINTEILEQLLYSRPEDCKNVQYNCYLSCRDINKRNLQLLKELNCFSVYMGIDGTGISSLKELNKGYTETSLMNKLKLLNDYSFKVEIGLILGNKGETIESLKQIVRFANMLTELFGEKIIVVQGNILIPMPGSVLYQHLDNQIESIEKITRPLEDLDIEQRIRKWLYYNTEITFEDCLKTQHEIETISPRKHSYVEKMNY